MASKLDWYKRNPAKFIGGTVGMTWDVKCVYSVVLDLIYDGGGSCPDDGPWIANILGVGMSVRHWNIIKGKLVEAGKLELRDGRIFNPAATRIIAQNSDLSRLETGGNRGNRPSKTKDKSTDKSPENGGGLFTGNGLDPLAGPSGAMLPARARESQSQNQTRRATDTTEVIGLVEAIAQTLGQPRGKYWATDAARMIDEGLEPADILAAAKAHKGGPIRSMNFLRGLARHKQAERERTGATAAPVQAFDPATMGDRDWGPYLGLFLRQGVWDADRFGPPPSRLGCLVPGPILAPVLKAWAKQGAHPREERDLSGNIVAYPSDQPDPQRRAMWEPAR